MAIEDWEDEAISKIMLVTLDVRDAMCVSDNSRTNLVRTPTISSYRLYWTIWPIKGKNHAYRPQVWNLRFSAVPRWMASKLRSIIFLVRGNELWRWPEMFDPIVIH